MTVKALLAQVDSAELTEWMAYDAIDPIGAGRIDAAAAVVAATIANVNRDPKKRSEPYETADFLPRYDEAWQRRREPPWKRMLRMAEAITAALGGKDLRKKKE